MPRKLTQGDPQKIVMPGEAELSMFPSEFTSEFLKLPYKGRLQNFSFVGREYFIPIYDTPAPRILMKCGRQTEKSTSLGNILLAYMSLNQWFKSLFVTPTQTQTETFSKDRITVPTKMSPLLQALSRGPGTMDNILLKRFITESELTFRYAFLTADRCRGIMCDLLCIDEIQDILTDVIPIIEECLFTSDLKIMRYSGTPKSVDNTLAVYWNRESTKGEWVIPCTCTGNKKPHWNIIGMANLGLKGLICDKCGKAIHARDPNAQWVSTRTSEWLRDPPIPIPFEGYRIPQVISPRVVWEGVLDKRSRYTEAQFNNEVMGLEFDSAKKLLTVDLLREHCCDQRIADGHKFAGRSKLYMGIDWDGGGEKGEKESYTVLSIGGYLGGKFRYVFFKRFTGEDAVIDKLIPLIVQLVRLFKVDLIGTDYGGGLDKNDMLIRVFGIERVMRFQYVNTKKLYFDKALARWMVNRSEAIMMMVNALRRKNEFVLPAWEDFHEPFAEDLLSLFQEYNTSRRSTMISKTPGTTDDTAHSMLYTLLVSMVAQPRPDLMAPTADRGGN